MVKVTVDGITVEADPRMTIIQAADLAGVEIPRFCYHERLAIAGNCRMCLVDVEKAPKPVASCAMPVAEGMVVHTTTPKVKKAREGVMEFLLINHPLDCPICDQGGECDLQDQAIAYGRGTSRYREPKRTVEDKYMGPLIKTHMTRCIHCTRCVRFVQEIAGVPEMGAIHRGEHMEITTYLDQAVTNELSGNVIDLCPVGALTARPYAFQYRAWELSKTESVDVLDAVGSNIRVDSRGQEVIRILPRLHEGVNEEWLDDKARFSYDGLKRQRLDRPMLRKNGSLQPVSWAEALEAVAAKIISIPATKIAAIAGDLCDAESMFALKKLMSALGSPHLDCRQDGAKLETGNRASYLFNTTIAGLEEADLCLLIGTNPRYEAPLINARLRKRYLRGGFDVYAVGEALDLTFPVHNLGNKPQELEALASGRHALTETVKRAKRPMLILGMAALARNDGAAILAAARELAENFGFVQEGWNGFNVLHRAAARVGGLDLGFVPGANGRDVAGIVEGAGSGEIEMVYLLGADEIDTSKLGGAFVVYQGHHGDRGAHRADVIFPGAAYTEKHGLYVNTEGRVQQGLPAFAPLNEAREDWTILRALSEKIGKTLPFDRLGELRRALVSEAPSFGQIDQLPQAGWGGFGRKGPLQNTPFTLPVENYYMTDPISRASKNMAECTRLIWDRLQKRAA